MDKYIGFDVDDKKTMACMVQSGCPDQYATLPTEAEAMRQWLGQLAETDKKEDGDAGVGGPVGAEYFIREQEELNPVEVRPLNAEPRASICRQLAVNWQYTGFRAYIMRCW